MWQAAVSNFLCADPLVIKLSVTFVMTIHVSILYLSLGVFRHSFWPNLGHGSKRFRDSGVENMHIKANGVMEFITLKRGYWKGRWAHISSDSILESLLCPAGCLGRSVHGHIFIMCWTFRQRWCNFTIFVDDVIAEGPSYLSTRLLNIWI